MSWGLKLTMPTGWSPILFLCEGGWLEPERAVQLVVYPTREDAVVAAIELALARSQHPDAVGDVGVVEYAEKEGKNVHTR